MELKFYSFAHFLKKIEFKGFCKWVLLNKAVQEEYPDHLDLLQIIARRNKDQSQDEIYQGLLQYHTDTFMQLNAKELNSLQTKSQEFKYLLKKATMVTYMLTHALSFNQVKNVLNIFFKYKEFVTDLKQRM